MGSDPRHCAHGSVIDDKYLAYLSQRLGQPLAIEEVSVQDPRVMVSLDSAPTGLSVSSPPKETS
jgi:hypothetical protein